MPRSLPLLLLLAACCVAFASSGVGASASASASVASSDKATSTEKPLRVGIIGGGISGASSAHWLREALNTSNVRFTLFERASLVGGRLQEVSVGLHPPRRFENGASILHASNRYAIEFAGLFNLTLQEPVQLEESVGIWNGNEFVLHLPGDWTDPIRVLWRYGMDFFRLASAISIVADQFASVYKLQDNGSSFSTPQELLTAMGVFDLTQTTFAEWLRPKLSSALIMDELAVASTRVNYGQDLKLNGLAGAIGLVPLTDPRLKQVKEGNARLVEGLLARNDVKIKTEHEVQRVERVTKKGKRTYKVRGVHRSKDADSPAKFQHTFDVVIIAMPLDLSDIEFRMHDEPPQPPAPSKAPFQTTHTTWLQGRVRPEQFAVDEASLPGMLLTTENGTLPFTSISAYAEEEGGLRSYKVFSRSELTPALINQFFDRVDDKHVHRTPWKAYPHFTPPEMFSRPFRLFADEHVYYPLALERAASCVEIQIVAARNTALQVAKALAASRATNQGKNNGRSAPATNGPESTSHQEL